MAAVSVPLNGHFLSRERSIEKDHSPWDFAIQSGQEVWQLSIPCEVSLIVKKDEMSVFWRDATIGP